jgi:hypothetical protein
VIKKPVEITHTKDIKTIQALSYKTRDGVRAAYDPDSKTFHVWDAEHGMHSQVRGSLQKKAKGKLQDLTIAGGDDAAKSIEEQLAIHKENAKLMEDMP